MPGGGTVVGVTRDRVMYENSIEHREESGTPNIVGSIRAAFAMDLKFWVGTQKMAEIEEAHTNTFIKIIEKCKNVTLIHSIYYFYFQSIKDMAENSMKSVSGPYCELG